MANVPNDPIMLMSFLNTQLRDEYGTLSDLVKSLGLDEEEIKNKLSGAGYSYDSDRNQFVRK
jgi:hypothetical protein